jgi:hypothetical protein
MIFRVIKNICGQKCEAFAEMQEMDCHGQLTSSELRNYKYTVGNQA